jgi:hypothetical protein
MERLRAMGEHVAAHDLSGGPGAGTPVKSWTKVTPATRQQAVRAVIPAPQPDTDALLQAHSMQPDADRQGAGGGSTTLKHDSGPGRRPEHVASLRARTGAEEGMGEPTSRKEKSGKMTLLQKQMEEQRQMRRQIKEAEDRKQEALRALLQNIKERQSRERERAQARGASPPAATADDGSCGGKSSVQKHMRDCALHDSASMSSLNQPSHTSSLPNSSLSRLGGQSTRRERKGKRFSASSSPERHGNTVSAWPSGRDYSTDSECLIGAAAAGAARATARAKSAPRVRPSRSKDAKSAGRRAWSPPSAAQSPPERVTRPARTTRARSASARVSPQQPPPNISASSRRATGSSRAARPATAPASDAASPAPRSLSRTRSDAAAARKAGPRRASSLAPLYSSPQPDRGGVTRAAGMPLADEPQAPVSGENQPGMDCSAKPAAPAALRHLAFEDVPEGVAAGHGVAGSDEGMTEWEALLADADRMLSARLVQEDTSATGVEEPGKKSKSAKVAGEGRAKGVPDAPLGARLSETSGGQRVGKMPGDGGRKKRSAGVRAMGDEEGSTGGSLAGRSSEEVRKFIQKQKRERQRKERAAREALEAQRLKIEANVQRISSEQARVIQREARLRLAAREPESSEPFAARPHAAGKDQVRCEGS